MEPKIIAILFSLFLLISIPGVLGETIKQTMEGGMDVEIIYPPSVVQGRTFSISVLIENNGWEDKQQITLEVSNPENVIVPELDEEIFVETLSAGGSYGSTIDFKVSETTTEGRHFLNVIYSQILLRNNETPEPSTQSEFTIPLIVTGQPQVTIKTITPESIFANAEFPFEVQLVSHDIDISDVNIKIVPPEDIEFRGKTQHTFSIIKKDSPISISSRISTPQEEIITEYKIPFQVMVTYTDDIGNEITESQIVELLLRPRTIMEITTDGGIWIGDFFIAPYVSLGTVIGIPAGAILSVLIRRSQKSKKKRKPKAK